MIPHGTPANSCSACRHSARLLASGPARARRPPPAASRSRPPARRCSTARRRAARPITIAASSAGGIEPRAPEAGDHAAHVVGPAGSPGPARRRAGCRPSCRRAALYGADAARRRGRRRGAAAIDDVTIDRHRQHEAVVVVGVLADQVDAPGRDRQPARARCRSAGVNSARGGAQRAAAGAHSEARSSSPGRCPSRIDISPDTRPSAGRRARAGSRRPRRSALAGRSAAASRAGTSPWCCRARSSGTASRSAPLGSSRVCRQVRGQLAVVDRLVHADVERLLARARVVERGRIAVDQVVDVDEVALHRLAVGIEHHRHRAASRRSRRPRSGPTRSRQRGPPNTSSPNESWYLKSSFSMIQGARRQQPFRSYWM